MFTGCIDQCGKLINKEETPSGQRFHISCNYTDLAEGESIAVNGVCLTVTTQGSQKFSCDVSPETLAVTQLGQQEPGGALNLERSLKLGDRLNGHFVLGHVDETVVVTAKQAEGSFLALHCRGISPAKKSLLVMKGCLTLNGVSLTVNFHDGDGFSVMLIPETLKRTNLRSLSVGDHVNIEYDYLAKLMQNEKPL